MDQNLYDNYVTCTELHSGGHEQFDHIKFHTHTYQIKENNINRKLRVTGCVTFYPGNIFEVFVSKHNVNIESYLQLLHYIHNNVGILHPVRLKLLHQIFNSPPPRLLARHGVCDCVCVCVWRLLRLARVVVV